MRLPEELWIRIGVWADCLPQLELLMRALHRRKPTKLLLNRALEQKWGEPHELRAVDVRRLWRDLGTYLQDLAQTWDDFVIPQEVTLSRVLYPGPRRRHVMYGLRYLQIKGLRKRGRFGVLALIG